MIKIITPVDDAEDIARIFGTGDDAEFGINSALPYHPRIQHRILTITWAYDNEGDIVPRYRVAEPVNPPGLGDNLLTYIKSILKTKPQPTMPKPGMFDIDLPNLAGGGDNHPRVVVLQLDPTQPWTFTEGERGVTAKVNHPGEDFNLRFVDDNGVVTPLGARAPANCHLLFWSVVWRRAEVTVPYPSCPRKFNFYVTHSDEYGGTMPTIFDPSIPNTGGGTIP